MIKLDARLVIFTLVFTVLSLDIAVAGQSIVLSDDVQMALGDAFMEDGDYYRAVTEYKKLTILFPESGLLSAAYYKIGMAYYRGQDYANAIKGFEKVRRLYKSDYFSSAAFYEGLSYSKLGQYEAAEGAFERAKFYDAAHEDAANAQNGLALNAFELNNPEGSRREFEDFLKNYPDDDRSPVIRSSFSLIDEYETRSRKSPVLAGTLSAVLPGSGQVYAEHYRNGLMAFVVNGLFIAGTVLAIKEENYPLAAIVGGVGLPFYIGNIYGAANAARKWNVSLTKKYKDELALSLEFHY